MPKTSKNSRPCACCKRLMPLKSHKRQVCGPRCQRLLDLAVIEYKRELRRERRYRQIGGR